MPIIVVKEDFSLLVGLGLLLNFEVLICHLAGEHHHDSGVVLGFVFTDALL